MVQELIAYIHWKPDWGNLRRRWLSLRRDRYHVTGMPMSLFEGWHRVARSSQSKSCPDLLDRIYVRSTSRIYRSIDIRMRRELASVRWCQYYRSHHDQKNGNWEKLMYLKCKSWSIEHVDHLPVEPVSYILPQLLELLKINGAGAVFIEHADLSGQVKLLSSFKALSQQLTKILTVSGLNGFQVPLLKAACSSVAVIAPDLSLSTDVNTWW